MANSPNREQRPRSIAHPVLRGVYPMALSLLLLGSHVGMGYGQDLSNEPTPGAVNLEFNCVIGDGSANGWVELTGIYAKGSYCYYFSSFSFRHEIRIFDQNGKHVGSLGKRGAGPGEFQMIWALQATEAEMIYAFDPLLQRLTIFSSDGTILRTSPFPIKMTSNGALLLSTGLVVVNSLQFTPDGFGHPLHVVSLEGKILSSFGATEGRTVLAPDLTEIETLRSICEAEEPGLIWSLPMKEYLIEKWDAKAGKRIVSHRLSREWQLGGGDLLAISCDDDGHILVIGRTSDSIRAPSTSTDNNQAQQRYDTVVDVIDKESGRLVATLRHDDQPMGFIRGAELLTYREHRDGSGDVRSWRVVVHRP